MALNKWIGMGRMVSNAERRSTATGKAVTSFTIAVDNGKDQEPAWIDCVAWDKTAEMVCNYFPKGKLIAIEGRVQTRNFEDKQGNKRKATEIVCDRVFFCGDKDNTQQADRGTAANFGGNAGAPVDFGDFDFVEVDESERLPF